MRTLRKIMNWLFHRSLSVVSTSGQEKLGAPAGNAASPPSPPEPRIPYEQFTDHARRVVQLANRQAQLLNHQLICTEHLLLALIEEALTLRAGHPLPELFGYFGCDLRDVQSEVERTVQPAPPTVALGKVPHSPLAKRVILYAIAEAGQLGCSYVGIEHLLLGLLRMQEGIAADVLMKLGLKLADVRERIRELSEAANHETRYRKPPTKRRYSCADTRGVAELAEMDNQLERLNQEKEEAVANQDFERAGAIRDQADKLKSIRERLVHERQATFEEVQSWGHHDQTNQDSARNTSSVDLSRTLLALNPRALQLIKQRSAEASLPEIAAVTLAAHAGERDHIRKVPGGFHFTGSGRAFLRNLYAWRIGGALTIARGSEPPEQTAISLGLVPWRAYAGAVACKFFCPQCDGPLFYATNSGAVLTDECPNCRWSRNGQQSPDLHVSASGEAPAPARLARALDDAGDFPMEPTRRERATQLNNEAVAAAQAKNFSDARLKWQAAISADPTWSVPCFNLARSYIEHQDAPDAPELAGRYLREAHELARAGRSPEDANVLSQVEFMLTVYSKISGIGYR